MLSIADICLLSFVISTLVMFTWLFLGVFREREYGTHHIFLKHRPTMKFLFIPPDESSRDSWGEKEKNQAHLYRLFVEERGGSSRSLFMGF